jgi:hypothetical protein
VRWQVESILERVTATHSRAETQAAPIAKKPTVKAVVAFHTSKGENTQLLTQADRNRVNWRWLRKQKRGCFLEHPVKF